MTSTLSLSFMTSFMKKISITFILKLFVVFVRLSMKRLVKRTSFMKSKVILCWKADFEKSLGVCIDRVWLKPY